MFFVNCFLFELHSKAMGRRLYAWRLTVWNGAVQGHSSLVGPAAGHVPDGVAPASQHQQRQVKALHVLHTLSMA